MIEVTTGLPKELVERMDEAAAQLNRSRAQVLRLALESYLEELQDLDLALERLQDPAQEVPELLDVRRALLDGTCE